MVDFVFHIYIRRLLLIKSEHVRILGVHIGHILGHIFHKALTEVRHFAFSELVVPEHAISRKSLISKRVPLIHTIRKQAKTKCSATPRRNSG